MTVPTLLPVWGFSSPNMNVFHSEKHIYKFLVNYEMHGFQ